MNEAAFYEDKVLASTEWYLHECDLPALSWARLRVFEDGMADVTWVEGGTRYGFSDRSSAASFLNEDEYISFSGLDVSDEVEHSIAMTQIARPDWSDVTGQPFEFVGTY